MCKTLKLRQLVYGDSAVGTMPFMAKLKCPKWWSFDKSICLQLRIR